MTWEWECLECSHHGKSDTQQEASMRYHRHYIHHHDTTPNRYGTREETP